MTWKFETEIFLMQGIKYSQNHWRTPGKEVRSFKLKDINVILTSGS